MQNLKENVYKMSGEIFYYFGLTEVNDRIVSLLYTKENYMKKKYYKQKWKMIRHWEKCNNKRPSSLMHKDFLQVEMQK